MEGPPDGTSGRSPGSQDAAHHHHHLHDPDHGHGHDHNHDHDNQVHHQVHHDLDHDPSYLHDLQHDLAYEDHEASHHGVDDGVYEPVNLALDFATPSDIELGMFDDYEEINFAEHNYEEEEDTVGYGDEYEYEDENEEGGEADNDSGNGNGNDNDNVNGNDNGNDNDNGNGARVGFPLRAVTGGGDEPRFQDVAAMRLVALLRAGQRSGLLTRQQLLSIVQDRGDLAVGLAPKDPNRFPKVPSEEGIKLMCSGLFGATDHDERTKNHIARRMLDREMGIGNVEQRRQNARLLTQSLIPGTAVDQIIHYDSPVYSGQFSDDGNFFYACCQDFNVHMYDTSNPYNWKHYKTVRYPWGQWTLTDATLSPDNRWLAYTSIQSLVSIAPTSPKDTGDPYSLELDDGERTPGMAYWRNRGGFGIWSIRFSGDGRELVAGTSAHSIVIYDIEARKVLHHIKGHEDDVNAVCFADKSSPHIIYSGSDDTTLKVWDRRSMGNKREAGAFIGHIEGLTYIDSKDDGRYLLSNGKDQSMKLWDLRMAMSTDRYNQIKVPHNRIERFDYRREQYEEDDWDVHPHDNSLVTFRGHKVLRTLIRCHFSPPSSTDSRYVYSGSADGKVFIWNLDATQAGVIDVEKATMGTRKLELRPRAQFEDPGGWNTAVRDASWHPSAPVLVASAWNGYNMAHGTCTIHSYNGSGGGKDEGEPKMGRSVDGLLRSDPETYFDSRY